MENQAGASPNSRKTRAFQVLTPFIADEDRLNTLLGNRSGFWWISSLSPELLEKWENGQGETVVRTKLLKTLWRRISTLMCPSLYNLVPANKFRTKAPPKLFLFYLSPHPLFIFKPLLHMHPKDFACILTPTNRSILATSPFKRNCLPS